MVVLDPYGVTGATSGSLNPLAGLNWHDPLLVDKARQVAEATVVRTGHEHERHWDDSAETVITAAIVFQVGLADSLGDPTLQTLGEVFAICANGKRLNDAMELLSRSTEHDGTVSALAYQVLGLQDRERASVMSSALRHLSFINTPATKAVTGQSTFDPAELRGMKKVTAFIIIPPNALVEKRGLIRSWLTCLFRAVVDAGADTLARVQLVLDEVS